MAKKPPSPNGAEHTAATSDSPIISRPGFSGTALDAFGLKNCIMSSVLVAQNPQIMKKHCSKLVCKALLTNLYTCFKPNEIHNSL